MSARMRSYIQTSLSLAFGVVGLGCSAVVDSGRVQCKTDVDCTSRGPEFAATMCVSSVCQELDAWSCAKHTAPTAKSSTPIEVDFGLMEASSTEAPVPDVTAALCGNLDIECKAPSTTTKSDASGRVRMSVAPLFDGYILLTKTGYDPTMLFLPALTEATSLGTFPFTTPAGSAGLGALLGKQLNHDLGRVLVIATGCDQQVTSGVTFVGDNMGDDAVRFYAVGGLPTFSATATDPSGFGGFFNVAPGTITIHASLEDGTDIGRAGVLVRPGHVSIRRLQPWSD